MTTDILQQEISNGPAEYTVLVTRDNLNNIRIPENLTGNRFVVTFTPVTDEQADELEFKSLKGIAGRELSIDEVRMERLGL